jgi:hypothetical protein
MADITRSVRGRKHPRNAGAVDLVTQFLMFDSYTKSLLHFNGAQDSTSVVDETGRVWGVYGNSRIDNVQSKFGGGSLYFDGSGDYIDTVDHVDFTLGSDDFTIDFWMRFSALPSFSRIMGQALNGVTPTSISFYFQQQDQKIHAGITSGSTGYNVAGVTTVSIDTWYHVAMVRSSNTLKLYLNGTMEASVDVTGVVVNDSNNKFAIGRLGEINETASGYDFSGRIDEFRISKGIARWTSNFTPPTAEY